MHKHGEGVYGVLRGVYRRAIQAILRAHHHLTLAVRSFFRPVISRYHTLSRLHPFMRTLWFRTILHLSVILLIISPLYAVLDFVLKDISYRMSDKESALVSASTVDSDFIKQSDTAITYNRADEAAGDKDLQTVLTLAANKEDATGKKPYQAELSKDAKDGITFSDSEGARSVSLTPTFSTGQGRLQDDRVVYPASTTEKHIYSFKNNGIKSDILLTQAPGSDTKTYSWDLGLDSTLEARMLPDGGVGIYSADPTLYGNLQISDQKSQDLVDKARKNAQKNTLVFELPRPFVLDANNKQVYTGVSYSLTGDNSQTLTLTANNLKQQAYPLSIDPTITVTTTADFRQKTGDTGNVDFGTDGEIRRGVSSNGDLGSFTTDVSSYFSLPRYDHDAVAYNGYMYVTGGRKATSDTACKDTGVASFYCNDVQYAPINADGSLGVFTTSASYFVTPRSSHATVAYNGFLYITGGAAGSAGFSDAQYAPLNADGTVGTWTTGTTLGFGVESHASVAYNGHLYVIGGNSGGSTDNEIFHAPLNADGSIGAWTDDGSRFLTPRENHASVAYNGYLYVTGGFDGFTYLNDVQYAPINADGTLGAWVTLANFSTVARMDHKLVAHNGYLYIIGGDIGTSLTTCKDTGSSAFCNDVQSAPISANGTLGTWTTDSSSYFTVPRARLAVVAYEGFLYAIGGYQPVSAATCKDADTNNYCNDVQYAQLGTIETATAQTDTTSYFAIPRYFHASVAYNGYLYITGGIQVASDTNCKNTGVASTYCNDVQYAPINADGTLGTWTTDTSSYFAYPRANHATVAYRGYMYIIGGNQVPVDAGCKDTGSFSTCNDVQYAPINADGTLGTWTTDTSSYFAVPRGGHASFSHNGFLYVMGGQQANSATTCKDTGTSITCNDVQYAAINADGTLGTFVTNTTYFSVPRYSHSMAVYNDKVYLMGGIIAAAGTTCKNTGVSELRCNDVQYATINTDGSIGAFTTSGNYFSIPRSGTAVARDGYLYMMGGRQTNTDTACNNTGSADARCNDIQRAVIGSDGSVGAFSTQVNSYFSLPRGGHHAAEHNGFIYITGGLKTASDTACKNTGVASTHCNDVQYVRVGESGGVESSFATDTSSYFAVPRRYHTSIAYGGYLYIIGGNIATAGTECKDSGTSAYCNDVQYAPINSDGTLGAWSTDYGNNFSIPRSGHASVVYNGHVYIIGGNIAASGPDCKDSGTSTVCNDVQYATFNDDGTLGPWTTDTSSYFSVPRSGLTSVAYNGYLYVIGGVQSVSAATCKDGATNTYCNDVQYAPINADGSLGTWTTDASSYFDTPRAYHTSVAYNGYLYLLGGAFSTITNACKDLDSSTYCNDVQYALINADGTLGTWTIDRSSYFASPRRFHSAVVANGYLYLIGGTNASFLGDVQYAKVNTDGSIGTWNTDTITLFSVPRYGHTSVAVSGRLYVIGGVQANSDTACKDSGTSSYCNDVQLASLTGLQYKSRYERTFDIGSGGSLVSSFTINGSARCDYTVAYQSAGSNAIYGPQSILYGVRPGVSRALGLTNTRYVRLAVTLDDSSCGAQSSITSISMTYNNVPEAPTLVAPAANATGVDVLPEFRLGTTDDPEDYVRYKIEVCADSSCASVVRTIDQTASQTGWLSQSQQSGTAYAGGALTQLAIHRYQPAGLTPNTQYWWRARAIDPAGTNTWSAYSQIASFTTVAASADNDISIGGGGVTIYGGTRITTGN